MKKFLSLFLIFSLALGLLTACGSAPVPVETTEPTEGVKKPAMNIFQKSDPAQDDTFNILMIGNSHCYYYADELVGLATAAGIKIRVSNVYYSGCIISEHYKWWINNEGHYQFITHDENGRTVVEGANLEYCLKQANWDAISLQTGTRDFMAKPAEQLLNETRQMRQELWDYIKTQFPVSKHYWHHSWSLQVGDYEKYGVRYDTPAAQHKLDETLATLAKGVCAENELLRIPTGPAWRIVRDGGYDELTARIGVNGGKGDYGHDGDTGGGQYLNACVWLETVLGQSCLGNTWRPEYTLSEEMINTLQKAAHQAVADLKAESGGM